LTDRPGGISPERRTNTFVAVLLAIALLSAIPRLLFAVSQFVEYDGYWHVFIAQQDTWPRFWEDVYNNAHPPLYFLLLKAAILFGRTILVYRSISLISGIASVFVAGQIARKITGSEARAWQSALAYGMALPAIIISDEVRSYMLSVLFVLLSFSSLLDIGREENDARAEFKARAGFCIWAILACLSEYFAFFYAGAAILVLLFRRRPISRWWMDAATVLPLLVTIAVLYGSHAGHLANIQGHLLPYYFDSNGRESMLAFVVRNNKNFLNQFLPVRIGSEALALVISLAGIVTCLLLKMGRRARWTSLVTGISLAAIIAAGIAGKYPYGGDLRQQFLLFPFLILCLAVVVERVADLAAGSFPANARNAANVALALLVTLAGVWQYVRYPKTSTNVLAPEMTAFHEMEPEPAAVYLDQFNLITFFIYHHDWTWTIAPQQSVPGIDIYNLRKGDRQMVVFRDKHRWNLAPDEPTIFDLFGQCLAAGRTPTLSVFDIQQAPAKTSLVSIPSVRLATLTSARDSGVCVERLSLTSTAWDLTLQRANCTLTLPKTAADYPPLQPGEQADDAHEAIDYVGSWTHGSFEGSRGGTLSYSNDSGAVARASFEGTEITYGFTRAFNRGRADVRIDGDSKGTIDLYSPAISWQNHVTYGHLPRGKHSIEIVVTGTGDPKSSDKYVDVDWLQAR
jgi:hypothetical protein